LKEKIITFIKGNPTVALTIITAYSWYCAYNYQAGFCSFFSVPNEYIDISTIDILKFASSILGISFILYTQLFDTIKNWVDGPKKTVFELIAKFLIVFSLVGYWVLFHIAKLPLTIYYIYFGTGLFILMVMIFTHKKVNNEGLKGFAKLAWTPIWYLNSVILLIPLFCLYVGYGDASKKTDFEVLSEHKSVAVIRRYGDNIILKNFNSKSQKFGDSIYVIKLGPINPLNLVNIKLIKE
jgi:hypothetical protein